MNDLYPPRPTHLVRVCQCGLELQNESMITTAKRRLETEHVDVDSLARDSLRYMAWDAQRVVAEFTQIDASAAYELEAVVLSERDVGRVLELWVGGRLAARIDAIAGSPTITRVAMEPADVRDGCIAVSVVRVEGPDAVLSELRLYSTAPPPPRVTVVGDSRGGVIVGVSDPEYRGIAEASVTVTWPSGQAEGTTDGLGLVQLPLAPQLPRGLRAVLAITARVDGMSTSVRVDTADLAMGLREVPLRHDRVDLSGQWLFAPGADVAEHGDPTRVPGHVVFDGLVPNAGVGTLWRSFEMPEKWVGDAVFLRCDGAYGRAVVAVNGQHAGGHGSGATSFDLDISDLVHPGTNHVSVTLSEYSPHAVIDYMSWYAHMSLLGIWRDVYVFRTTPVHLGAVDTVADWNSATGRGSLTIRFDVRNSSHDASTYDLDVTVTSMDGTVVADAHRAGDVDAACSTVVPLKFANLMVDPWSAEAPTRYVLRTELRCGTRLQSYSRLVGFRHVEVVGNELQVNGKPIRVLGVNRHDARLLTGRALSSDELRSDVTRFREANVNTIRTSHYPADPRFADLCDEIGMYLFDQPPICWLGFLQWNEAHKTSHTIPYLLEVTAETVSRDARHPSVLVWDLANESEWSEGFAAQLALAKQLDPTRPAIFSFDLNEQVSAQPSSPSRPELHSYHYPGLVQPWQDDLKRFAQLSRPVVCDEYMPIIEACQRFPHEAFVLPIDPGIRDYWVVGMAPFLDRLWATPNCIGGMIWSGVDDLFAIPVQGEIGQGAWSHLPQHEFMQQRDLFRSDDSTIFRGDGQWGVLDCWGRPRAEHWNLAKMYSPIRVEGVRVDADKRTATVTVRNLFAHRSLSTLTLRVRAGASRYQVPLLAEPGNEETVRLPIPAGTSEIELVFVHPEGWVVDGHVIPVTSRVDDLTAGVRAGATGALEVHELITHGWLADWPTLHLQSADRPDLPLALPVLQTFAEESPSRRRLVGDGWSGELHVSHDERATVFEYRCTYRQGEPFNAREVGLAFRLPTHLRDFWWLREGEWTYYPDHHIGRTAGYASPRTGPLNIMEPASRWEDDVAPSGHVDYRSARRRIRAAGLTDGTHSVTVLSDGNQTARVALDGETPVLHVLDWYGGVRTLDPVHPVWSEYLGGGRRIEPGSEVSGTIRLVVGSLPAVFE